MHDEVVSLQGRTISRKQHIRHDCAKTGFERVFFRGDPAMETYATQVWNTFSEDLLMKFLGKRGRVDHREEIAVITPYSVVF